MHTPTDVIANCQGTPSPTYLRSLKFRCRLILWPRRCLKANVDRIPAVRSSDSHKPHAMELSWHGLNKSYNEKMRPGDVRPIAHTARALPLFPSTVAVLYANHGILHTAMNMYLLPPGDHGRMAANGQAETTALMLHSAYAKAECKGKSNWVLESPWVPVTGRSITCGELNSQHMSS